MTTKTSSFNVSRMMGFYRSSLSRIKGLGFFYFVLSFGFMAMQYIINVSNVYDITKLHYYYHGSSLVYAPAALVIFPIIQVVTAIAFGIHLFSYIHSRQAVDMYHSMPVTRGEMAIANMLSAMTVMIVTIVFNFGVIAITAAVNFGAVYAGMAVTEMLYWIIISFAILSITSFATVNVGTVFDSVIFTGALLSGFSMVYATICLMFESFVFGYYSGQLPLEWALRLSPVTTMMERVARSYNSEELGVVSATIFAWLVIGIILTFLTVKCYEKRSSEMAQTVGNMGPVQVLVRTGGVFLGGFYLGLFLTAMLNIGSVAGFVGCVLIASLVIYALMELILSRNVARIVSNWKVALGSSLVVAIVVYFAINGGFGYETKVPGVDTINNVEIECSTFYDTYYTNVVYDESSFDDSSKFGRWSSVVTEAEGIEDIANLHRMIVDNYKNDFKVQNRFFGYRGYDNTKYIEGSINVSYNLKNGKSLTRCYSGYIPVEALEQILKINVNSEIMAQKSTVHNIDVDDIKTILVYPHEQTSDEIGAKIPATSYEKILAAMQSDLESETVDTLKGPAKAIGYLEIQFRVESKIDTATAEYGASSYTKYEEDTRSSPQAIMENYENTIAVLRELDILDEIVVTEREAKDVYISPAYYGRFYQLITNADQNEAQYFYRDIIEYGRSEKYTSYQIKNPKEFVEANRDVLYTRVLSNNRTLPIMVAYTDGSYGTYFLPLDRIPSDAKEYFKALQDEGYHLGDEILELIA